MFGVDDMALAYGAGSVINAFSQPDPAEQLPGNLVMTDPRQWQLYGDMVNAYQSGSGDFGYGSMMRSGESQLSQALADRGISADSGVYTSALTNLIAQAQSADAANRYQYGISLLNSPPSTAVITGENQIPGTSALGSGGTSSYSNTYVPMYGGVNGEAGGTGVGFNTAGLVWDEASGTYVPA